MYKRLAISTAVLASMVAAVALAEPAPKTYTLSLTEPEIITIANLVRKGQYDQVADLLSKIQKQIDEQIAAEKKAADEKKEPTPSEKKE